MFMGKKKADFRGSSPEKAVREQILNPLGDCLLLLFAFFCHPQPVSPP